MEDFRPAGPSGLSLAPSIVGDQQPLGLILAGGRARRMGGTDKTQLEIGGLSMRARIVARLRPQCRDLLLSAPRRTPKAAAQGLVIVPDTIRDAGPLAGVLAGLDWAAAHYPDSATLVSVPGDCPFIPADLVVRLEAARQEAGVPLACAKSDHRTHPVVALWPVDLRHELRRALTVERLRKVDAFSARYGVASAEWPTTTHDPFFNVNTPQDAVEANRIVAMGAVGSAVALDAHAGTHVADLRDLKCPLPALRTRKLLATLTSGETLSVHCTDPLTAIDIPHLLQQTGDELVAMAEQDGVLVFHLRKA